jgi:hypothetical protein
MTARIRIRIQHLDDGPNHIEVTARYRSTGAEPGPVSHVETIAPGTSLDQFLHTGLDITLREVPPPARRVPVNWEEDGA